MNIDVVTPKEVVGHALRITGVEYLLDRRLVTLGQILLQLVPSRPKPGAA
jgi:hypothetical protein